MYLQIIQIKYIYFEEKPYYNVINTIYEGRYAYERGYYKFNTNTFIFYMHC